MQKISTICSCLNSNDKISILVDSFKNQKYKNKELLIIDGTKSKENFNNLKKKFFDKEFLKFFHLPNGSIYECLNLGITESSGSIINIMGDDDFFIDNNLFNEVNSEFIRGIDLFYGDTLYEKNKKIVRYYKSFEINKNLINIALMPSHTSSFISKNCYNKIGLYDNSYKIASDLDFYFRVLKSKNLKYVYKSKPISIMTEGGQSNKSLKNIIKSNLEAISILRKNKLTFPVLRIIIKLILKLYLLINFRFSNEWKQ